MPYGILDPTTAAPAPVITAGQPLTSYGKTLASLSLELQKQLIGRQDIDTDRMEEWINDAYLDVVTSLDLDSLKSSLMITTVVDQPLYLLPEVVHSILHVGTSDTVNYPINGGRPLTKIDLSAYRKNPDVRDEPREYFRLDNMLVLWPTPKAIRSIAVDFHLRPAKLTLDTHSPFIDREWHEGIALLARAKALDALQEFDKAPLAFNSYTDFVRRRLDPLAAEDETRVVGSSVPRSRQHLISRGRTRFTTDGAY